MKKNGLADPDMGRHNADFEKSVMRFTEGATWKRQRVAMILPADKLMPSRAAVAMMSLIFPPNNGVFRYLVQGDEVGVAYSRAFEDILSHPVLGDWEYALTVEVDNIPPQDGVLQLLTAMDKYPEYDALSGLYWTKGEGGCPQIWGDIKDPVPNYRPQPPKEPVQECYGIGMGFALWRLKMFKDRKLTKPWFKTSASKDGVGTQDLYFWDQARALGHRCAVVTDCRVGHLDVSSGKVW